MSPTSRLCARGVEFESVSGGDGRTLEGYAAVFRSPTMIDSWEGRFEEEIARGAFTKTLAERMPVLQFDHGRDVRTGTVPIGKIDSISEDARGLFVRARLYENSAVEPIRQAIEGGSIDGMSFRFKVVRDEWTDANGKPLRSAKEIGQAVRSKDAPPRRIIREVELYEAGPVVFPAYASTSVGVRSLLSGLDDEERTQLVREIAEELLDFVARDDDSAEDAAPEGTSEATPDAAPEGTSGHTEGMRAALLRDINLRRGKDD